MLSSHLNLPSCADTLLKDQMEESMKVDDNYHFLGMKDNICRRISAGLEHFVPKGEVYKEMYQEACKINKQLVTLSVNIDGISLFKSSSVTMWPITCRVNESNDQAPFVIGVYVGASKPSSLQDFLTPFVLEYLSFSSDDFFTPDGVPCRVKILNFICDAPARSLVKGTKSFSGYNGCDYCRQVGVYDNAYKKIVYSATPGEPRSDERFALFGEVGHQRVETPLSQMGSMITSFPPDPMHAVFLGVVRRLILIWVDEKHGHHRISPSLMRHLSGQIIELGRQLPMEFSRKLRPLSEVKNWKAVEFRCFLLYVGPIVLKDVLSKEKYEHFLLLHFAIFFTLWR